MLTIFHVSGLYHNLNSSITQSIFLAYGRTPMSCVALRDSLFIDPYGNICIILDEKAAHYRDLTKVCRGRHETLLEEYV